MDALELKSDIHNLIDKVNDLSILNTIKTLLNKQLVGDDLWDELPESIKIGLKQSIEGNTIPHESVMNEFKEKYRIK